MSETDWQRYFEFAHERAEKAEAEIARYKLALEYAKRHLYPAWETNHLERINEILATKEQK